MSAEFRREMGGTERMRLRFPNINVVMAARIQGNLTASDLKNAVRNARRLHPLLGARVVFSERGKGIFRTDNVPENPIQFIPRQGDREWFEVVKSQLRQGWDLEKGPLARFALLHSPAGSDLVVNAHHSICDGRSLAYLICDLLSLIADPDQELNPRYPVPLDQAVPNKLKGGFLYRLMVRIMNRKWLRRGHHFSEKDFLTLHHNYWKDRQPRLKTWSLNREETSQLVARCKLEGISVNSAIYAAFLAAQERCQDTSAEYYQRVMVPVDFRNHLEADVERALGMYSSAVSFSFDYLDRESFWQNARRLDLTSTQQLTPKNIFGSQKTSLITPTFFDGIALAMFGNLKDDMARNMAQRMRDAVRTGLLVSNLGNLLVPEKYGYLTLKWIKPPAIYGENAEKSVEVLTIGGEMHFMISYGEMGVTTKIVERIIEGTREILTGLSG